MAGCTVPLLPVAGFSFAEYDKLNAWYERLMQRSSWQTTQVTPEAIAAVKSRMAA